MNDGARHSKQADAIKQSTCTHLEGRRAARNSPDSAGGGSGDEEWQARDIDNAAHNLQRDQPERTVEVLTQFPDNL